MNSVNHAYTIVRDKLAASGWPPGAHLPSLGELARECGVSRTTMWRAVGLLKAELLIDVRNRGAIIAGPPGSVSAIPSRSQWLFRYPGSACGDVPAMIFQVLCG